MNYTTQEILKTNVLVKKTSDVYKFMTRECVCDIGMLLYTSVTDQLAVLQTSASA